jgi:hypothetical protein
LHSLCDRDHHLHDALSSVSGKDRMICNVECVVWNVEWPEFDGQIKVRIR